MKREYLARVIASLLITHTLTLRPPIAALGDVEECVGMDQKRAQIFLSAMGFPTLDVRSAHKDMRKVSLESQICSTWREETYQNYHYDICQSFDCYEDFCE
jgi:hypothetical protein